MFNRITFISALILSISLAVNWVLKESEVRHDFKVRNDPDVYMLNPEIATYSSSGELHHLLSAARFTHFPLTDLTTLKKPRIELKSADKWDIRSVEGRLLSASTYRDETIELWDNVHANHFHSSDQFIQIETNSLTFYPSKNYLETDNRVHIKMQTGQTTAEGMRAFLETKRLQLFSGSEGRVNTIFLTNRP